MLLMNTQASNYVRALAEYDYWRNKAQAWAARNLLE